MAERKFLRKKSSQISPGQVYNKLRFPYVKGTFNLKILLCLSTILPIYNPNSETNQGPSDHGLLPSTSQKSVLDFEAITSLTETRERNNERPRCDHVIKDCVNRGKWQRVYCNSAGHFKTSTFQLPRSVTLSLPHCQLHFSKEKAFLANIK